MKRVTSTVLVMSFALLIVLALPATGMSADTCSIGYVKKALANNMTSAAVRCLNTLIETDPANGQAHFLKGKYCLGRGDYSCARERFGASSAKRQYSKDIERLVRSRISSALASGKSKDVINLYGLLPNTSSRAVCQELYQGGNKASDNTSFVFYKASRHFCGSANDKAIGKRYMDIAQNLPVPQRKLWVERAAEFIGWKAVNVVFPAPYKKVVFQKTFIGRSFSERNDDNIRTVQSGVDVQASDVIRITGKHFLFWSSGKWSESKRWAEINVKEAKDGGWYYIQAPSGDEIVVEVKRTIKSY